MNGPVKPSLAEELSRLSQPEHWERLLWSLGGAMVALLLGRLLAWLVVSALKRWSSHTRGHKDDILVKQLGSPVSWLLPIVVLALALPALELGARTGTIVTRAVLVALTLNAGWIFMRAVRVFEELLASRVPDAGAGTSRARSAYTQVRGLSNVARFLISLITIGLVLLSFAGGREVGVSILASAGAAGLVLGLALQRTIATVVAGLVIAIAQPIRINDAVFVEGELGIVEEIGLTFVLVRLLDRRCIVLPVNYFLERPFQNWSRLTTQVRANVRLVLDFSAPIERLREELKGILEASAHWDKQTWDLSVSDSSATGITLSATASASDALKATALRSEIREKLLLFVQSHCPEAFPQQRSRAASASAPVSP